MPFNVQFRTIKISKELLDYSKEREAEERGERWNDVVIMVDDHCAEMISSAQLTIEGLKKRPAYFSINY